MALFETILTEGSSVRIRVRADSPKEANDKFVAFQDSEPEYLAEELDINGTKEWTWTEFTPVSPNYYDECATISQNDDGTFEARYEGGDK